MAKSSRKIWRIHITGVVQSVGFRPFIKNLGDKASLKGYVLNLGDAGVEILIDSTETQKDKFIVTIKDQLPELAIITSITTTLTDENHEFAESFEIRKSKPSTGKKSGFSALPPDIAICPNCNNDIFNQNRRVDYPFTSCTDCGPRYATIMGLPYDRPLTSFNDFPLCPECMVEYTKPSDRRFHAQTTCCQKCGPQYNLYEWNNDWQKSKFDWNKIVQSLKQGKIVTIMGLSGTHFVLDAMNHEIVQKFRNLRRQRSNKPFAVMMKSLDVVKNYCEITDKDAKLLQSARKPIIILPLKNSEEWQDISPGLNTLGVMLPYGGFHHLLFSKEAPSALIMTSANLPGIPMPISPELVLNSSRSISDIVLVHNRRIIQRNDDSVVRSHGDTHLIIRRARGYTPQPFFVKELVNQKQIVAFGGEENNTVAFQKEGWVLPSQHLGHITNLESQEFQNSTCDHLQKLFNFEPEMVLADLHPEFLSTTSAMKFASDKGIPLKRVQHHVAHAASLALDNSVDPTEPMLTWVCDGFGYGPDGNAWGGELLLINDGTWERLSSLIPVDYHGGDQNARYPARMLLKYLREINASLEYLSRDPHRYFLRGEKEFEHLASRDVTSELTTTSMGRLLDSFAVLLGVADRRSYRSEPAIKLEGLASKGQNTIDNLSLVTKHNGMDVVDNLEILKIGLELINSESKADIALWVHETIGKSLSTIAGNISEKKGIMNIGFSGGVAYNKFITHSFKNAVSTYNIELLTHKNVPPGDGGVSTGQIYYNGVLSNEY